MPLSLPIRESVRAGVSNRCDFPLVASRSALLVIDVQRHCCDTDRPVVPDYYREESLPRMLDNVRCLLEAFRKKRDGEPPPGPGSSNSNNNNNHNSRNNHGAFGGLLGSFRRNRDGASSRDSTSETPKKQAFGGMFDSFRVRRGEVLDGDGDCKDDDKSNDKDKDHDNDSDDDSDDDSDKDDNKDNNKDDNKDNSDDKDNDNGDGDSGLDGDSCIDGSSLGTTNESQSLHEHQPPTGFPEVIFVMIQSMTNDGRDLSIDYKLSGPFFRDVPTVSSTYDEIFFPAPLAPDPHTGRGDIVVPKTACSAFCTTNLDVLLRRLFVEQLVVCGQLTDQCVESAVRDAADLGYLVTVAEDACAAHSEKEHYKGLFGMNGFCRILTTRDVVRELERGDG